MKCVTKSEISAWLRACNQIEDPYTGESKPKYQIQFYVPERLRTVENFVRYFLESVVIKGELLLVGTDFEPATKSQEFIHQTIRIAMGVSREPTEAPGYLFAENEWEEAVALFSLMSGFGWKCFLYGNSDQVTLYNWEGLAFDVWTDSEIKIEESIRIVRLFEFKDLPKTP